MNGWGNSKQVRKIVRKGGCAVRRQSVGKRRADIEAGVEQEFVRAQPVQQSSAGAADPEAVLRAGLAPGHIGRPL